LRVEWNSMAPTSLPNPDDIVQATLANGLRVLVRENHSSPSVVIDGYLPGGSVLEPAAQAGLASFTAAMLMRGTTHRTFEQINEVIEAVGASLGVYSGRHVVGVGGKCLAEDFGLVMDVLGDVLQRPTFPLEHIERVRGQRLTSLQERDNDTRAVAALLFRELAYPAEHPYGSPIEGHAETVSALQQADLASFYHGVYGPTGGVLVIVGAVQAGEAVAQVEQALGAWPGHTPAQVQFPPISAPVTVIRAARNLPGKTQTDIVLGIPALRRSDPDYDAARLADTVLGRFGMMGRLGENVREQLGLAYHVYSTLEGSREPGPWTVVAGVNPADVDRCLAAIDVELLRLTAELAPEEELADSKAYLAGSLPLRLETNEGVAAAILDMAWYDLGLDYLLRYRDRIERITAEQVRAATARFWQSGAYVLAMAGPGVAGVV
jgi:zinc protease